MSRVINVNSPGKIRNQERRTIAEILRQLVEKPELDAEAKDMVATIVYSLRTIYDGVDGSAQAWEKRGYWMKAERFMRDWRWTIEKASDFEDIVRNDAWDLVPEVVVGILPHFNDIGIKRYIRPATAWRGAYERLLAEEPRPLPY